jgi:GTP pyrophosphokinase
MILSIDDAISCYQSLFGSECTPGLNTYLHECNTKDQPAADILPISNALLSNDLVKAVQQHQGQDALALAALCLPYALTHKLDRFQALLDPATFLLLKQCCHLHALEKLLHTKNNLSEKQSDQLRKMLLAMAGDTRVILLILLYQLILLKNLKDSPKETQTIHAQTAQNIYAPLANRLGMGQIKWQLEDWSFRYINPIAYQEIKKALNMRRQDRENYVMAMQQTIKDMVSKLRIKTYECEGRAKHIYSIYKKCSRKQVGYDALYDTIALRILTKTVDECYLLLSAIHDQFTPITVEFDDYIANPKPNGYQSIHTAIIGPNDLRVEIQMRTFEMHHQAEHGAYAHWIYKEGQQSEAQQYEQKIAHLRQLLEWQKSLSQDAPNQQTAIADLFTDRIYVFSPQGRIIDLPQGSTALDFAYTIHTDVGHKTKGAQINGKLQPLNQPLANGDEVFIQTKKEGAPSRDWLNPTLHYLKSKQAKQKVAHWFKLQNQKENLLRGQQIWEKAWRAKKLEKNALEKIYQHFNFKDVERLLTALGTADISVPALCQQIKQLSQTTDYSPRDEQEFIPPKIKLSYKTSQRAPVTIDGNTGLLSQIARCCRPIPGDPIVAYATTTRGVMIHQADCPNIIKSRGDHPEKILPANWTDSSNQAFEASLKIAFQDRDNFLHDVISFSAKQKLPIKHLSTKAKKTGYGPFELDLTVLVQNPDDLEKLISGLKQIPSVLMISRAGKR